MQMGRSGGTSVNYFNQQNGSATSYVYFNLLEKKFTVEGVKQVGSGCWDAYVKGEVGRHKMKTRLVTHSIDPLPKPNPASQTMYKCIR